MTRPLFVILILFASAVLLCGQNDPDLGRIPLAGLPAGSTVLSYAVVRSASSTHLVVEAVDPAGTAAFFIFEPVEGELRARPIGARSLPGGFREPALIEPVLRSAAGLEPAPYWPVGGTAGAELVSAPDLSALRYEQSRASPWRLSPPPDSRLAIRHVRPGPDEGLLDSCVIEPNITAVSDRLTTAGAWRVDAFGEPHLLVAFVREPEAAGARVFYRLYTPHRVIVAETGPGPTAAPGRYPELVVADLTGDGVDELVFFSTSERPEEPLTVYRFERRDGDRRVLSFTTCGVRMNGGDVSLLQRMLEARGFPVGVHGIDGWYGPDTRAAVILFQRSVGVAPTGVVSEQTWRLLHAGGRP